MQWYVPSGVAPERASDPVVANHSALAGKSERELNSVTHDQTTATLCPNLQTKQNPLYLAETCTIAASTLLLSSSQACHLREAIVLRKSR